MGRGWRRWGESSDSNAILIPVKKGRKEVRSCLAVWRKLQLTQLGTLEPKPIRGVLSVFDLQLEAAHGNCGLSTFWWILNATTVLDHHQLLSLQPEYPGVWFHGCHSPSFAAHTFPHLLEEKLLHGSHGLSSEGETLKTEICGMSCSSVTAVDFRLQLVLILPLLVIHPKPPLPSTVTVAYFDYLPGGMTKTFLDDHTFFRPELLNASVQEARE